MTYAVNTHDSWGVVKIGNYQSLEEARTVFGDQCDDLRDKSDGTVGAWRWFKVLSVDPWAGCCGWFVS